MKPVITWNVEIVAIVKSVWNDINVWNVKLRQSREGLPV
jgi:hypothetical protein